MTERQQLEGLQKIRTDTIEQATKLLRSASESEKPKLEQTIRESSKTTRRRSTNTTL